MLLKELRNQMGNPEDLRKFNEDINLLFPADSAHREVLDSEYCTLDVFVNLLIKRLESMQERINAVNPDVIEEIAIIGALFIAVMQLMARKKLIKPDEFAEYCENFCNAAGSFEKGVRKALELGFLSVIGKLESIKRSKDEIIN